MFGKRLLFIALSLLAFSLPVLAQSTSIKGRVADPADKAIPGATVVLRNKNTGLERVGTTDGEGRFSFTNLGTGTYEAIIDANGFARFTQEVDSANADISVKLDVETLREEVTVISGSRQEELRESLNTKVDVISRSQLRDTGSQNVAEVLREIPGIVTRRGSESTGGGSGEQVQGIDSRQVLVLLDGQPVVGARGIKSGRINLDRQSTEHLESIEVVKGSSSALFGSDAIGGVINMRSREAKHPFEASVTGAVGNFGIFDGTATAGFKRDKLSGFFSFERHKNNGFDLTPTTFDTTAPGFHRNDIYGKLQYQITDKFKLTGFVNSYFNNLKGRSVGETGSQNDNVDEDSQNYGLTGDWAIDGRTTLQVRGYFSNYDEITNSTLAIAPFNVLPGALHEKYAKFDTTFSRIIGERQLVQAGFEYYNNEYSGLNRVQVDNGVSINNTSAWAQDKISITNRLTLTLGVRFDRHSIFGNAASPKAGLNYRVTSFASLRASWGRGFRAPDLGQLYYRFANPVSFYQVIGNKDLSAEHSGSWQAGGEFNFFRRKFRFGVNFFRNDIRNLINSVNIGLVTTANVDALLAANGIDPSVKQFLTYNLLLFVYKNTANAKTQGVEFDTDIYLPHNFAISGAYTYLDTHEAFDLPLTGRHPNQGYMKLAWERPRWGFRGNVRGTLYSDWINTRTVNTAGVVTAQTNGKQFGMFDIYAAKSVAKGFELFGAIDNFLNQQDPNTNKRQPNGTPYAILRPEAGRTYRLGFRWSFDKE
jgi:outer membrane receptor for ferrienterochelin and colicins